MEEKASARIAAELRSAGFEDVRPIKPEMIGDDFSQFGRTVEKVPT